MRVCGGVAGGIPLIVPKTDLRPTMDMVKNAIFSSLGEFIIGARVLDLFAGCGSLGIEALSRGAASATFVERDRKAVAAIRANLEKTRFSAQSTVFATDVGRFLEHPTNPQPYHVILADPPYRKAKSDADYARLLMECRALPHLLLDGGIFILEHTPGIPLPTGIGWTELRRRRYGATEVVQFTRGTSSPAITEGVAMIDP